MNNYYRFLVVVGNPGVAQALPTTPPENLFIIKNLNLIPFLIYVSLA
jgi:hypothetical protein